MSFVCSVFTSNAGNTSKNFTSRAWLLTVEDGSYKTQKTSEARKSGNSFFIGSPENSSQSNHLTAMKMK